MAAGLTQTHYSLQNVTVVLDSLVTVDITELQIKRTAKYEMRKPGSSKVAVRVLIEEDAEITIKGWNGPDFQYKDIVPGKGVSALAFTSQNDTGTPSILATDFFTQFPITGWVFGDTDTSLGDKPSLWSTKMLPNCRNKKA